MSIEKLIVIGGSAAGAKAAAKARRLNEFAEITIIQKAHDLSMAACGYPYYVGGLFDERNQLLCTPTGVVRDPLFFANAKGIRALNDTEAVFIDRQEKMVHCRNLRGGNDFKLPYDKLIIATGAVPNIPPVGNSDLEGITTFLTMEDTDYLRRMRDEKQVKNALIIGGGLIGIEACEALWLSGIEVTVVEILDQVLPFLDWQMAELVANHMRSKGVEVITGTSVKSFLDDKGKVKGAMLSDDTIIACDLVIMAAGVRPNSVLAREAGIAVGELGGITVNQYLQTSDEHIYAAGDCVEKHNCNTGRQTLAPLGDLANLEGRVAGENAMLGNTVTFPGTYQTGICKVFDFTAGATGITEKEARAMGLDYVTAINAGPDKPGFMGAKLLVSKMLIDRADQRLLGFQCVGLGDVSKEMAMAAVAIKGRLSVEELVNLDLPYAPPFSLAIDHFIAGAHIMQNKLKGRMKTVSAAEVWQKVQRQEETPFYLDGRSPEEYEEMHLGIGEKLIPIGALRKKMHELPADKEAEIICFCKVSLRGYEAAIILAAHGYTKVRVMEGGIMAWPYPRGK